MIDLFTKLLIYLKDKKCKSSSLKLRKYIDLLKWGSLKSGTPWDSDSARTRLATYHRAGENSERLAGSFRMIGADRSFVTVGRSFTVAKGFSPL